MSMQENRASKFVEFAKANNGTFAVADLEVFVGGSRRAKSCIYWGRHHAGLTFGIKAGIVTIQDDLATVPDVTITPKAVKPPKEPKPPKAPKEVKPPKVRAGEKKVGETPATDPGGPAEEAPKKPNKKRGPGGKFLKKVKVEEAAAPPAEPTPEAAPDAAPAFLEGPVVE